MPQGQSSSNRSHHAGSPAIDADDILDAALQLAEQSGWDALHLGDIATTLDIELAAVAAHYAGKDALAERWFDRADEALLAAPAAPGWQALSPRERLREALLSWFGALAAHRPATRAMLAYKLQPDHLHLHALGVMRVSRTVQWVREVAGLRAVGWRREVEEVALTGIYLASFACWLRDESPDATRTRALLERLLTAAEGVALRLGERGLAPPSR